MGEDYYKTLGIEKGATEEEIKKAYHQLAHKYHPDKQGGNEARFKEINEAYQVLSDRNKRQQYDQFGQTFSAQGGPASGGGFGFDFSQGFPGGFSAQSAQGGSGWEFNFGEDSGFGDIFEGIFGGNMGGRKKRKTVRSGSDIRFVMDIDLEESYKGVQKEIIYETLVKCAVCGGVGHEKDSGFKPCEKCDGRGEIKEVKQSFFGAFASVKQCPSCFGEGKIAEKVCKECHGRGRNKSKKKVFVDIQAGISDGQIIRVAEAGEDGERGSQSGDLYVEVNIRPHKIFKRQGADLITEIKISMSQIILGAEIELETLSDKKIIIKVPAGTEVGQILRVKGRGMPYFGRSGFGDLLVRVNVKIPKKVSHKAEKLLQELEQELQ